MSISAMMNSAYSGMQADTMRLSATASNVANASTPGYTRLDTQLSTNGTGGVSASVVEGGGPVDLADEAIDTVESGIAFKASAAVFETGADLWDVLMSMKRD